MNWKASLLPSEVDFMEQIIEQVPTVMGARGTFVGLLEKLLASSGPAAPKFRYVIVTDGDVMGTNDDGKARQFAASEEDYVIDVQKNLWLVGTEDDDNDTLITEAR